MMNLYSRTLAHKNQPLLQGDTTHRRLKLACFVCYLKILNTSWKKNNANSPRNSNNHGVENLVGHARGIYVMNQNSKIIVLINNSKTAWPTFFFRAHV